MIGALHRCLQVKVTSEPQRLWGFFFFLEKGLGRYRVGKIKMLPPGDPATDCTCIESAISIYVRSSSGKLKPRPLRCHAT